MPNNNEPRTFEDVPPNSAFRNSDEFDAAHGLSRGLGKIPEPQALEIAEQKFLDRVAEERRSPLDKVLRTQTM